MNVRETTPVTLSLIVLIIGFSLLIPLIQRSLPYEVWRFFEGRSYALYYIGGFHAFMTKAAVWLVIIVGFIDAILKNRAALSMLSSLNIPIALGIPILRLVFIPVSAHIFWGLFYVAAIIGVYWTFRKFIGNNHPGGQKLIPFIKGIKAGAGSGSTHVSDRYAVFGVSLFLVAFYALLIVSFAIYVIANWSMLT